MSISNKYPDSGWWSYSVGDNGFLADSLGEAIGAISDVIEAQLPDWKQLDSRYLRAELLKIREKCLAQGRASDGEYWSIWFEGEVQS